MKNNLELIIKSWNLLSPFHKRFYLHIAIILSLSGMSVSIAYFGSRILEYIPSKNIELIILYFSLALFLEIIWNIVDFLKNDNERKYLEEDIQQHLQEYSLRKILALTVEQHVEDHSAIKQLIIVKGEDSIIRLVKIFVSDFLPIVSYLVIAIGALFWYSIPIGFIVSIACIVLTVWIMYFSNYIRPKIQINRANWIEQGKIRTEAFTHLQLVKLFAKESYFIRKYIDDRKKYVDYDKNVNRIRLSHRTKRSIFISSFDHITLLIAILLALRGVSGIGGIFLVWTLVGRVFWSISSLSNSLRDLPLIILDAEKYFDAVELPHSYKESGKKEISLTENIVINNLIFKYKKSAGNVLENLSLTIEKNKKTAIVGASGSGKSTITKILLRAYNYTSGSITIGNVELKDIDAHYLREHIGYVEQHVDLLDDTIKENILFGVKEYERKKAESNLEEIAHLARIDQFYHRLGKDKFDTQVGERGIKLSGGERQRIGIARAIIKNPEILIFDEATSSLDTENEKYVMDAINEVSKGKTTIIIAHRLSTVKNADKIIVMDKGEVVGEGTHEYLIANNNVYQNLVAYQI